MQATRMWRDANWQEVSNMAREKTMVREYTDKVAFHADEMQLGREGWSVQSTTNNFEQTGMIQRVRSLFTPKVAPRFVVTYSRPEPS